MMGFDRIEAVSLTDQFVQKIEAMIISGELVPGDQLPPAREMSARMGVSRPVISAGLVELEKMGFVEIVTRQGVYVSDYRKSGSLDTLTALLNYNGGVMRDDEVRSLLEVRGANECAPRRRSSMGSRRCSMRSRAERQMRSAPRRRFSSTIR